MLLCKVTLSSSLNLVCLLSHAIFVFTLQIKPPSSPTGRFTQILSVGIGGSALGPQFVAEALAPDNPPLKVSGTALSAVKQSFQVMQLLLRLLFLWLIAV